MNPANIVDILLLIPIIGGILLGIRRGFVFGATDLISLAISFTLASSLVGVLAPLISNPPDWLVSTAVFLVLFLVAQILFGLIIFPLIGMVRRVVFVLPLVEYVDMAAGIIPGAIKGALVALSVLVIVGIWSILPASRGAVNDSAVGRALMPLSASLVPYVNELVSKLGLPIAAGVTASEGIPNVVPASSNISVNESAEADIFRMLNEERVKNGLQPLRIDPAIREVARSYSEELFRSGRFDHQSPVSGSPADRLTKGKVPFEVAGENLAYAPNAVIAHNGLMNSPGHRANILSPRFSRVGIGVVQSPGRGMVVTQNFAD